jgi:ketosteroid isomerase-like protein
MSQENVEVVVRQFESVNARDFAAVMDAYTEDVTVVPHGDFVGVLGGQVAAGRMRWLSGSGTSWTALRHFAPYYRFEVEESRDLGDRVLIVATHHGRGRTSGVPVTTQTTYLYTVRKGKISRVELWDDRNEALEAAGLRE